MDEDDPQNPSVDDALEEERSSSGNARTVDNDNNPSAPADDVYQTTLPDDHPDTDSDMDETETYQEGLPSSSEK